MAYVVQLKVFTAPTLLLSEIVINVSWMSTALQLFIVTQARPCRHLYLYLTVTFFEISRLILCTPILTTTNLLPLKITLGSGKGNTINSTSAWEELKIGGSGGASVLLTAGWTYLFIFPFLCRAVHMFSELFTCHLCDWQWGAKPVSRVACLLSRNSSQHVFTLEDYTLRQTNTQKHTVGNCLNLIDTHSSKNFFVKTTTQTHVLNASNKHTLVHAYKQTKQTVMLHSRDRI